MKDKEVVVSWMKLKFSFFEHSKVKQLLTKFGPSGPWVLLNIWRLMYSRNGRFDSSQEYEIDALAEACKVSAAEILNVCSTAVKSGLLIQVDKEPKGVYYSEAVTENMGKMLAISEKASESGKKSGEVRRAKKEPTLNGRLTTVEQSLNQPRANLEQKERKTEREIALSVLSSDKSPARPLGPAVSRLIVFDVFRKAFPFNWSENGHILTSVRANWDALTIEEREEAIAKLAEFLEAYEKPAPWDYLRGKMWNALNDDAK